MTLSDLLALVRPGDALLYRGSGFIPWLIRVKTWSPVSHIEVVVSPFETIAARESGSAVYPISAEKLYEVWRPKLPIDVPDGMAWFMRSANGQKYDLWGLFRFFTIGKQSTSKQFCSELATRFYRAAGLEPFTPETDADLVSPGMFRTSSRLARIWERE